MSLHEFVARRRGARGARFVLAASASMVLALAACGSDGDGGGTESVSPDAAAAVPAYLLGTHVGLLGNTEAAVPPRAGAIRLWDAGVTWRELEPKEGEINWAPLDNAVTKAQAMGVADILWVHGSTPQWAAKDPTAEGIYGPGTSSEPKKEPYLNILRQIAERYKGRITSYQVWNEANIEIFYTGSAQYLAELTGEAKELLAEVDPAAKLVGASTTVRSKGPVKDFYEKYAAALKVAGWPIDAMSAQLYPPAEKGPDTRVEYIRIMKKWLSERGWTGELWDTEINYGDRRDFAEVKVTIPQSIAPGYVARTYLDSLALGVQRVYWYAWNDHILGIDQIAEGTNEILPAGQAYLTLQDWLIGATLQQCSGETVEPSASGDGTTTCSFTGTDGKRFDVMYTSGKSTDLETPEGAAEVCLLDGKCQSLASVASLQVGGSPILVRYA
ncbi:MAG: endo-1,4-beta-xylanase [Candidatus Nanopelagicales bacterium]